MILQGVEFSIFLLIFEWALQQCRASALPFIVLNASSPKNGRGRSRNLRLIFGYLIFIN